MTKPCSARCLPPATPPILPRLEHSGGVALSHLKQAHARLLASALSLAPRAATALLRLCSRAAPPDPAYSRLLFDTIPAPNSFAWTCLLRAQSKSKTPDAILALYKELLGSAARPNGITFSYVLKACADLKRLWLLAATHAHCLALGFQLDALVSSSLVHSYVACGSVDNARMVLDELSQRDLVSWTEVINGYVREGRATEAIDLFFLMSKADIKLDEITVVAVAAACSKLGDLSLCRELEGLVHKAGIQGNKLVANSLIDIYGKCGSVEDACRVFKRMVVDHDVVSWNSLVGGYMRSADTKGARRVFDQMPNKNGVSWSLLINGYVQNSHFKEALIVYQEMLQNGLTPNAAALTGVISACAQLGVIDIGQEIHLSLDKHKVRSDVILSTALVDMYAKCGCLETASSLFKEIKEKNLASWNAMMMAFAINSKASECLHLFSEMLSNGFKPNGLTFTTILSACAYAGWLEQAHMYFKEMVKVHQIVPRAEHYSCMAYLMARAGLIAEACEFVATSTVEPDEAMWGAILSACRAHGCVEAGELTAKRILELNPHHTSALVQLSGMYASVNMWEEVEGIRMVAKDGWVGSHSGRSCIEIDGTIHEFVVGFCQNGRVEEIHSVLGTIYLQMALMHSG